MKHSNLETALTLLVTMIPETEGIYAYGSGAIKQPGYEEKDKKQYDLIIVVDDIEKWHKENLRKTPEMYSWTAKNYFQMASKEKQKWGTPICFITYVKVFNQEFKLGIVEKNDVIEDLKNWNSFLLAGRFQKEMLPIQEDEEVKEANELNRNNAMTIALLTLEKETATKEEVCKNLFQLSYYGEFRNSVGAENPNKVNNLVRGSFNYFIKNYSFLDKVKENADGTITRNYTTLLNHIKELPDDLKIRLYQIIDGSNDYEEMKKVIRKEIIHYFEEKNKSSSFKQAVKGVLTTGVINSIQYAKSKFEKGRKRS